MAKKPKSELVPALVLPAPPAPAIALPVFDVETFKLENAPGPPAPVTADVPEGLGESTDTRSDWAKLHGPTKAQHEAVKLLFAALENDALSITTRLDAAEALLHPEARDFLLMVEDAVEFLLRVADKSAKDAMNAEPRERVRAMSILLRNPIR